MQPTVLYFEQGGGHGGHPKSAARVGEFHPLGVLLQVPYRDGAGAKVRLVHHTSKKRRAAFHTAEHERVERSRHARDRRGAGRCVHDEFPEQRVVVRRNVEALDDTSVPAYTGTCRRFEPRDDAGRGQETRRGVFGDDSALDGVPSQLYIFLTEVQELALGDAQLPVNDVQPGDELGNRVLHL